MAIAQAHGDQPQVEARRTLAFEVREAAEADRADWDEIVAAHPGAAGYHEWAWRGVFQRSFGHEAPYLVARRGLVTEGVLPLVEIRSRLFGHFLTSLPYVNYGGVLARTEAAAGALVEAARHLSRTRGCRHLELRHMSRQCPGVPVRQHKVTMRLAIDGDLWGRLDRKVRNQVRKARKSGLSVERGDAGLLSDFYAVFARNMRDLGTPVCSRRFFSEIVGAFPDRTRVLVVRQGDTPVAAGISYRTGCTVEIPWASSLRAFNSLCPNHLLFWHAIEAALGEGARVFDFGRSTPNEGTFKFKAQWGAEPVSLNWEYPHLEGGVPDQGPTNPRFQAAIAVWKRCPLWLTNTLGPRLVRGIP